MDNPAIVVVTYKRAHSLLRLLGSLQKARFEGCGPVRLVISIDGGGDQAVADAAEDFNWPFGEKTIRRHERNLGLRAHILECGGLTAEFGSIILLEDDLYVSPEFYRYILKVRGALAREESIAGISLYTHRVNLLNQLPFDPINTGPGFLMRIASSWGQYWDRRMWDGFRSWYDANNSQPSIWARVSHKVSAWPESSWQKYFIAYLEHEAKYFYYPRTSFTSNCGDAGTHFEQTTRVFSASLDLFGTIAEVSDFDKLARYDSFFELEVDFYKRWMPKLSGYDFAANLWGEKQSIGSGAKFVLVYSGQKGLISFGTELRPLELNVLCDIAGRGIELHEVVDSKLPQLHSAHKVFRTHFSNPGLRVSISLLLESILENRSVKGFAAGLSRVMRLGRGTKS